MVSRRCYTAIAAMRHPGSPVSREVLKACFQPRSTIARRRHWRRPGTSSGNQGTVGGSICHADPQGDWGSVMLALEADFVARSEAGERIIKAADFFQGPFTTALRPDEVLTEIRIPLAAHSAGAYNKLERKVGDFATVAVAVQVEMNGDKIAKAGIGLTSVGDRNLKARDAEKSLAGKQPTDEAIAEAARLAAAAA